MGKAASKNAGVMILITMTTADTARMYINNPPQEPLNRESIVSKSCNSTIK